MTRLNQDVRPRGTWPDLVTAPRRSTPEMRTLSPSEAGSLLEAASGERLEALYVLAVTYGLLLGELQALRWRDVDLDGARLRVTATYQGTRKLLPREKLSSLS